MPWGKLYVRVGAPCNICEPAGSWNRSRKIGYRITLVCLEGNKPVAYEPSATGWLQGETAWGRPADVLVMRDGALLLSDDYAGAIYRTTYRG